MKLLTSSRSYDMRAYAPDVSCHIKHSLKLLRPALHQTKKYNEHGTTNDQQYITVCPYTWQWAATFPLQNCLSLEGSAPSSNTWYLGPIQVSNANHIWIGSAFFAGLTNVINKHTSHRQTDHAILCKAKSLAAMQPNNNNTSLSEELNHGCFRWNSWSPLSSWVVEHACSFISWLLCWQCGRPF